MSARRKGLDLYELLLASRLLRSKRSTHLSIISVMSISGIALGVGALIVVLAVNTGFQIAFQERILSTYPHLVAMRRGLEMQDYREVAARLMQVPQTRQATPATYDDMMLASASGRAGAVVRGVPAASLANMPQGVIVDGAFDLQGEAPVVDFPETGDEPTLQVRSGTATARHILVAVRDGQRRALESIPVLRPQGGLGALLVFEATGCGLPDAERDTPTSRPAARADDADVLVMRHDFGGEVVRRVSRVGERPACRVLANWETLSGDFELSWTHAGKKVARNLRLQSDRTTVLVLDGVRHSVIAPAPARLPPTSAAFAAVALTDRPLTFRAGQEPAVAVAPGEASRWLSLAAPLPDMALGEGLAARLQVKIGDEVRAVSPLRGLDRGDSPSAQSAAGRFRVGAIVRTGFYDHDQRLALVDFPAAQRFLNRGDVARWVDVRVDDPILASAHIGRYRAALEPIPLSVFLDDMQAMRRQLQRVRKENVSGLEVRAAPEHALALVDNWVSGVRAARQARTRGISMYRVIDWEEMNRNIFDAARMQKVAMSLFPFIIVLVAALNVIGTQAVVVHERARDISILRAMGATPRSVGAIFLTQGLAVGLLGTVIGLAVGGLTCVLLQAVGYPLDPHVYLISELPVRIEAETFVLAGGAATALSFGAAWISARRAADRSPVDGLRRLD